jgi:DNA repair exonuclease SbcCD nuclease subunit
LSEKFRGLFIPDTHLDNRTPTSRMDDYLSSSMEEFYEILYMAQKMKCHYIVHLGDVFHRADPMGICRNQVLDALKGDKEGNPWGFDIFVCVGNHDINNSQYDLQYSALGTLIKVGAIQKVDFDDKYGIGFGHFNTKIEKQIANGLLTKYPAIIWATHATVTLNGGFPDNPDFVEFRNIEFNPECRLLINGHIHHEYNASKDEVSFVNPGSLARNDFTPDSFHKAPHVVVVDYYRDGSKLRWVYQELKNYKLGKDIFNYIEIKESKSAKKEMSEYMTQIAKMTHLGMSSNLYESVRLSGIQKQIDDVVLDVAISELRSVEEARKFL